MEKRTGKETARSRGGTLSIRLRKFTTERWKSNINSVNGKLARFVPQLPRSEEEREKN